MRQQFDCAIIVQLLCISQVDEKQILQNLCDLGISMVNRHEYLKHRGIGR
jgi:hypothetical protein